MNTEKIIRKIGIFLLGMMLLATSFGEAIKIFKINISWIFAVFLVCVTVMHSVFNSDLLFLKDKKHRTVLVFALTWLCWAFIQRLWVINVDLWQQGIISMVINIFLIIEIWYFFREKEDFDSFAKYAFLLWCVNIGLGLYETVTDNHFLTEGVSYWDLMTVRTFFGNPNDCATWMVLSYLLAVFFLKRKRVKYSVLIEIVMWVTTTIVVIGTASRACLYGMLACPVVALFSAACLKLEGKAKRTSFFKPIFWLLVLFAFVLVFYVTYSGILESLIELVSKDGNKVSDLYRVDIIKDTIAVAFESMFLGVGANQTITYVGINPHNFFLELLSDYGLIIFLFTCYFFVKIINAFFNKREVGSQRVYCLASALTVAIVSISSSSMNRLRLTWVLLVFIYFSVKDNKEGSTL